MDQFLGPETDTKRQFQEPEIDMKCQFLLPETYIIGKRKYIVAVSLRLCLSMSLLLSLCASVSLWSKLLVEAFPIVNYGVEIHHKTIGAISNLPTKPLGDPIGVRGHF